MNIRFRFLATFALSLSFLISACSESFTDSRDGQSYDVVKIGDFTWMAENLNYETETSACPDGDSRNCKRLGRLYTWAEAKTVCPEGWRLPTKADFEALMIAAPGNVAQSQAGNSGAVPNASNAVQNNHAGLALKAKDGWFKKGNGTDEFGFNALPAGYRGAISKADDGSMTGGKFDGIGGYAYFWSATEDAENPESNAYYLFLSFSSDAASLNSFAKEDYRSVRCVR
ncbi:fibrobacter succinogenes major paralogous domain-containing protein [Fibrobacter succinogenes]|uniref:fibrobacter succinogenes major paralogous domain-containing protein n=1 Tax=Fibrobacter succinogenes TaxID=833 RepID=UPI001569EC8E|nr:fibrobacter succinogenes major paralogous domain-containing protein [Fibrobacter succinogenes]